VDEVFRALADPHRRWLLDRLFERDGQTLTDLCAALPELSRFGVMKHLSVLADANLVVCRREGRHKLHYLNPVPIRQVHDRWVSKFAAPWVGLLEGLREDLERAEPASPSHHAATA
jgi:DNA-binding transcriptional ArsR family regulator